MDNKWIFSHVGIVVKDLNKTLEYYRSLGIFEIPKTTPEVLVGRNPDVDGPVGEILKLDVSLQGLNIELIQPLSGDNLQQRFLDKYGEGMHHVCFEVSDVNSTRLELAEKGVKVACHIRKETTYYNTGDYGQMLLEIRQKYR